MKDDRIQSALDEWFDDTDPQPPDTQRMTNRVLTQLPQTRQRGRWLPFRLLRSKAPTPTVVDTTEYRSRPNGASNGHTPTIIGRTQSMLSPAKAITAGAIVFAIGGAFLITGPFGQQTSVPGAEAQGFPTPDRFTSEYTWSGLSTAGSSETLEGDIRVVAGEGWLFDFEASTDPRFSGPLVMTFNVVHHPNQGNLSVGGYRIETDDGAWQQIPVAGLRFQDDLLDWRIGSLPPAGNIQFGTFLGEGDYDGLIAVFQETWWPDDTEGLLRLDGWVVDGELPEAPEPWVP